MEELQFFLKKVNENGCIWLLEATSGLFAMLEDGGGNSYIPVWESENAAKSNIGGEWVSYNVASMDLPEFIDWTRELESDGIGVAISAGTENSIFPIPAKIMRQMLGIQDVSDKELVGEEFYDEEWAEPMPEDWNDDDDE
ncbi:MAG: DUF2750 domain-containing protein [Candidatus Limimorpha sp.]